MKKCLAVGVLAACLLTLAGWGYLSLPGLPMEALNAGESFSAELLPLLRLPPESGYTSQQGAATDGTHAYYIMENQSEGLCTLWKVDMDGWQAADSAPGLSLGHGNDMTWNPRLGRLIVAHNKPQYTWLSFIDPETLEVSETRTLPYGMFAIAYCEARDRYVIGLSGTYHFAVLDGEFGFVAKYNGVDTGYIKQGVDCDENFIYFPQSSYDNRSNLIMVYDWEGNFVARIGLQTNFMEIETIFHDGEDYYAVFNGRRPCTSRLKLKRAG